MTRMRRVLAVDWSGDGRAESVPHPKLWLAEAVDGQLTSLEPASRQGVVRRALALADEDPHLLVGLDFSFSYPRWFVEAQGFATGAELWPHVDRLDRHSLPFFGWKGSRRPAPHQLYRACEEAARRDGLRPSSTFQVNGPGSVGTGSLRGMPHLALLRAAGCAIWPWDEPADGVPLVVEAYPRAFARSVVKSHADARADHVATLGIRDPMLADLAGRSDDAFDAAVTALGLARVGTAPTQASPPVPGATLLAEGWIFRP